jgi:hypothetical protein
VPHDADLSNLIAGTSSQHEQFHIKSESANRQAPKQIVSGLGTEELESTLRVRDAREHEYTNECIEDTSDHVPEPVLAMAPRPRGFPRPDDQIWRGRAASRVKKPMEIVQGHGQISIGHEPPRPARLQHPTSNSGTFASPRPHHYPDPMVRSGIFVHRPSCTVGTPIVDHNDLPGKASALQVGT